MKLIKLLLASTLLFSQAFADTPPPGKVTINVLDASPATQTVTVQDTGSSTSTNANGQVWYFGTPTTGSAAVFPSASYGAAQIEITGTWTGTLQTEISVDGGTTYVAHSIHQISSPFFLTTFTGNVIGSLNMAAKSQLRIRAITAMTGTATIKVVFSLNQATTYIANSLKIVDAAVPNVSTPLTIKPASTAPLSTDAAVVVTISPNSPGQGLPTGAATSANQTTEIGSLATIATNTTSAATSTLQSAGNTSLSTIATNTTNAATSTLQTTGNTSLATIATNTSGVTVAQGSTTSGQNGQMVQGAVTTSAPSYTTAKTSPLSLNLAGGLRVDGSGVTQPVSQTAGATPSQTTGTVSTVITLTAPTNAQGFILQNLQSSTANLRFALGATATTSLGMQLAPGQDSGFFPTSANISLVSESGTQNYNVQWVAK